MPIKMFNKQDWLVQVQRGGVRRTRRGTGGEAEARKVEAEMLGELTLESRLDDAARLLGVDRHAQAPAPAPVPTLRQFFDARWVEHAKVVQNASTRAKTRCPWNYALCYLGDKLLTDLLRPAEINAFIEAMKKNGGMSFTLRGDGEPWGRRKRELTNATINQSLKLLRALLFLAHAEGVIPSEPKLDLLPMDDSTPVIPPTETQFRKLLAVCEDFREVAPLLPEVTEFTAETGLRRGEIFHLTWGSVDLERDAIRIEMQARGRMVNGRAWRPKHNKWREVPLSARAKAILLERHAAGPTGEHDLVFPNKNGAPYTPIDGAEGGAGKGFFFDAVAAAGLKGKVTFHGLRHLFAVRLLTKGVPITVVSEMLGHADINLTVKRYGRFSTDAKVKWDAIKALDAPAATLPAPAPPPSVERATTERKLVAIDGGRRRRGPADLLAPPRASGSATKGQR
jgi:integrase